MPRGKQPCSEIFRLRRLDHTVHFLVNPLRFLIKRSMQCSTDYFKIVTFAPNIPSKIMHHAIPHRTATSSDRITLLTPPPTVEQTVLQSPVVVFGRQGCCMCHVVKRLLLGHGVNPVVVEVEEGRKEVDLIDQLWKFGGRKDVASLQFPVMFVGGKIFGGLETLMAAHISGDLVPLMKAAGALWL